MATVTLLGEELARGDFPHVCLRCGSRRGVTLVQRAFVWRPYFSPWMLLRIIPVRRLTTYVPLCEAHGGFNWFPHRRSQWWGLRPVGIENDRMTLAGVSDEFADALRRHRQGRREARYEDDVMEVLPADAPPSRRSREWRDPYPAKDSSWIVPVIVLCVPLLACGGFCLIGGVANLFMPHQYAPPPPFPPPAPAPAAPGPVAAVAPAPENVVVGLLGGAAGAGGPGGLPWGPLALAGKRETFQLLDDVELDRALADLRSMDPDVVAAAAQKLAKATPDGARRGEAGRALRSALDENPFPTAKEAAAEALGKWGTADDVQGLLQDLTNANPNTRAAAMTALAGLKDERGAAALAARLDDFFDREKARQALEAMGPVAEKAVVPMVGGGNAQTRVAACDVLKTVGTPESLPVLEAAARDPDVNVARGAADAAQAIRGRHPGKQP